MSKHGNRRSRAEELVPNTIRVISVRLNYWPQSAQPALETLSDLSVGYISRYALGRDYHTLIRRRLQRLADMITGEVGEHRYRAFADSGPVMEKPLASKAGLGWMGKHTNLIDRAQGSWFFIGELYTDLPLPIDAPQTDHCGSCSRCIDSCPTGAIIAPYQLDARLCISYLTIEYKGTIPIGLRSAIGNRIFGCDDCQLVCPWNQDASPSQLDDFSPRHGLDSTRLVDLFLWSRSDFEQKTIGSPLRRTGYECWLRNLAVALGNAPRSTSVINALMSRQDDPSSLVREHTSWALRQHERIN